MPLTPDPAKDGSTGRDYFPRITNRNIGFRNWSPVPVGFYSESANFWGVRELIGNGWEWTQSEFHAFPGFTPYMTHYQEYSADFFDGKHFVLKGGVLGHRCRSGPTQFPQLVSGPLSLCVCQVSLR